MRVIPGAMQTAWEAEDKTGPRRPVVRATVHRTVLHRFPYDTADPNIAGGDFDEQRKRKGVFTSIIFADVGMKVLEIPNIRSFQWSRSVNQDVAEATLELKNTELTPLGQDAPAGHAADFDQPGFFSPGRGDSTMTPGAPWGYQETGWGTRLVPDRIVRTYEGYGCDPDVHPHNDPNLLLSGTWIIDSAEYTADGNITVRMRDVGVLLLHQICFPPVIPYGEYPLEWITIHPEQVDGREAVGGTWTDLKGKGTASSSNDAYIGKGLTNAPKDPYVTSNGGVEGHHANHALENGSGYWLSTGQDHPSDKVWWQVDLDDATTAMAAIKIHTKGGPFKVYVSLHNGTKWLGKRNIPYEPGVGGIDNGAEIPFVMIVRPEKGLPEEFTLKRKYGNIAKIRLTFAQLRDSGVGEHPFWAGLKDLMIYKAPTAADLSFKDGTVTKQIGNYRDYTDIVKWVCAWGGFYWPPHSTGQDFINYDDTKTWITYASRDVKLPSGRVWGDFMNSGTAGVADLTLDLFDKKPLMDVINYVRDILGFVFWIDETGGVVWRLPNIGLAGSPKLGNYLSPTHTGQRTRTRTSNIITLDDEKHLMSYSTTLSSANSRERIFVGDSLGKIGTVIKGFDGPYPRAGFRRIAGWTDQHFATKKETRVMADMIAAQQMFAYRKSRMTIWGNPAIQIDDQIRVSERVTNDPFYHYVESISSSINMEEGTWTYDLETHWLGTNPSDAWVVRPEMLDTATQNYLAAIGGSD